MASVSEGLGWRAVLVGFTAACAPRFESSGTLDVDAHSFVPTTCVVTTCPAGIELGDAAGYRLALAIPPQALRAWQRIDAKPLATWSAPGATPQHLGECGTLVLRGQGYHDAGKRAASGQLMLACAQGRGQLDFTGCF